MKRIEKLEQSIEELQEEISLLEGSIKCDIDEQVKHPNIISGLGDYAEIRQLISGDYAFNTRFGRLARIELKTVSDLIGSIATGRMSEQLAKMPRGDIKILLVQGWLTVNHNGYLRTKSRSWKRPYNWLWNYLLSAQCAGTYIYLSPNEFLTPRLIISIFDWFNKDEHSAMAQRQRLGIMHPQLTPKQLMFCTIPGVGDGLAKALDKYFHHSMQELCNAPLDEIEKVESISEKKKGDVETKRRISTKQAGFIYNYVRNLI